MIISLESNTLTHRRNTNNDKVSKSLSPSRLSQKTKIYLGTRLTRRKEPGGNPADLDLIKRSPFVIRDNKSKPIFEHDNTGEIRAGIQQNHKILGHGRNPIINTVGVQDLSANRQEIDIEKIFTPEVDLDKPSSPRYTITKEKLEALKEKLNETSGMQEEKRKQVLQFVQEMINNSITN